MQGVVFLGNKKLEMQSFEDPKQGQDDQTLIHI